MPFSTRWYASYCRVLQLSRLSLIRPITTSTTCSRGRAHVHQADVGVQQMTSCIPKLGSWETFAKPPLMQHPPPPQTHVSHKHQGTHQPANQQGNQPTSKPAGQSANQQASRQAASISIITCGSGSARWNRFFRPCTAATLLLKQGQVLPAGSTEAGWEHKAGSATRALHTHAAAGCLFSLLCSFQHAPCSCFLGQYTQQMYTR